jgi:putative peptidoglycan lipid II flippase
MNAVATEVREARVDHPGSVNRRIFNAALLIGTLTMVVKAAAMAKEMLVAATFGTDDVLDAFLIAYVLPSFLINILGSSFSTALVPAFIAARQKEGEAAGQRLLSETVAFSSLLMAAATVLLALLVPYLLPVLAPSFGVDKLARTEWLFYALLPIVLIGGVTANWEAVLNADRRFAWTALVPVMVPLTTIAALLLGVATMSVYALVLGTVAGMVAQLALLGWGLRQQGLSLRPRWPERGGPVRAVARQYLPIVAGSALISSNVVIDQTMAALLDPGSVAALNYGTRLVIVILSISAVALGTAVLPFYSDMVAAGHWRWLRQSLRTYIGAILLLTVPVALLGFAFSGSLVQLLFLRGRFTASDAAVVSDVLAYSMLQLPFYAASLPLVGLINSMRASHVFMWGNLIAFVLNVTLNYLLMQVMGVAGIALSTALVLLVAFVYLAAAAHRIMKKKELHSAHEPTVGLEIRRTET